MRFTKLNSRAVVNVNIARHLIDWERVVSRPQKQVKDFLRPYWAGCVVLEEFRIPGSRHRVDLMNVSRYIAVEVSPSSSHSFNSFFHKTRSGFGAAVNRDLDKAAWLELNGFRVVEISTEDLAKLSPAWFKDQFDIDL